MDCEPECRQIDPVQRVPAAPRPGQARRRRGRAAADHRQAEGCAPQAAEPIRHPAGAARARQDARRRQGDVHRPARSGIVRVARSAGCCPRPLFLGFWFFMMRRMAAARRRPRRRTDGHRAQPRQGLCRERRRVTFADVAGVDEAKDELARSSSSSRTPSDYGRLGAHIPKGMLLVGPPGTGKTLLARAVAGEAGRAVLLDLRLGVRRDVRGRRRRPRARPVQAGAREGARRSSSSTRSTRSAGARQRHRAAAGTTRRSRRSTSCSPRSTASTPSSGVVLLGATNRPEVLDPALLRAGRFDRQVLVDRPGQEGPRRDPAASTWGRSGSPPTSRPRRSPR